MENPERAPNHTQQGSAPGLEKAVGLALFFHNFDARMVGHCIAGAWMKMARAFPSRRNDDNNANAESARTGRFDLQINYHHPAHDDLAASESV